MNLLKEFYTRANNNGLKLPKVSSFFDDYSTPESLYDMLQKNGNCWPLKDLVELAGLAQHYEIPTRLLDWSTDFYMACYFACVKTFDRLLNKNNTKDFHFENEISEPMAIFALNIETLKHLRRGKKGNLRFIRPSYADNPNLNAQKGLFTYWELEPEFDPLALNNRKQYPHWWGWIETDIVPLEVLIAGYQPQLISQKLMYKFVVPSSQCVSLYDHLRRLGYGKARLFPGYAGVKSEIDEDRDAEKLRELITSHVMNQK